MKSHLRLLLTWETIFIFTNLQKLLQPDTQVLRLAIRPAFPTHHTQGILRNSTCLSWARRASGPEYSYRPDE